MTWWKWGKKAFMWRIIASAISIVLFYLYTGRWDLLVQFGIVEFVLKILAYMGHERFWENRK